MSRSRSKSDESPIEGQGLVRMKVKMKVMVKVSVKDKMEVKIEVNVKVKVRRKSNQRFRLMLGSWKSRLRSNEMKALGQIRMRVKTEVEHSNVECQNDMKVERQTV